MGDLIDGVLARIARADVAPVVRLRRGWEDVAGSWADRCRPMAIAGDALVVEVDNGMEASMLRYQAGPLVGAVRECLGPDTPVARLVIKVSDRSPEG